MRKRDTSDVLASAVAVLVDGCAVFSGFALATWIKFDSGWLSVTRGRPDNLYVDYLIGAAFATLLFLVIFQALGLFVRPQTGSFVNKIPRIVKATAWGELFTFAIAFAAKNEVVDPSRMVIGIGYFAVLFAVLLERYILFRIEWNLARHSRRANRVLIVGTDAVASHVKRTVKKEPMLRSKVVGFLRTDDVPPDPEIPAALLRGNDDALEALVRSDEVDQVILTASSLSHERILQIILLCEQNLVTFNMVPDLFRIMTSSMDVQSLNDIPLLGISRWPLDNFWNRVLKRAEDLAGATVGLILAAPIIAVAGVAIKLTSPGPVFFRQERCGEDGRCFPLYKLRTMAVGAEAETGPVFAVAGDPRATRVGSLLRRFNLDELPQLWNVLCGQMGLVGPRPERPHFVERFRADIDRYMWRHVSKPGLTGWAQVHGLRGNTSISERLKYDLYYLENWSIALDFKILVTTLFARENAY